MDTFPLKRLHVPAKTFEKLWEELQTALHGKVNAGYSPGSAKYFGMGDFSPKEMPGMKTVASVIADHPEVKKLMQALPKEAEKINFGGYLYKQLLEAENKPSTKFFTFGKQAYIYGYFRFLGFPNMEAFEEHHGLTGAGIEHLPLSEPTYYLGSFFSVRSYAIKHFIITIDYAQSISTNVYPAEEWGFHKIDDPKLGISNPEYLQDYTLSGTALIRNSKLFINLTTPEKEREEQEWTQMNIMGLGFGVHPDQMKVQRIIRCNIQTVSVVGYPVAVEAVLVRIKEKHWKAMELRKYEVPTLSEIRNILGNKETDALILYLMLQRRNFWVRNEPVDDLSKLKVRGNITSEYLYLKGTWRVWNYGLKRGTVVQSKLIINDNFASSFHPFLKDKITEGNPRLKEQVATLFISKGIRPNKLFFHTYQMPYLAIINTAIFDLDTLHNKGNIAEGMFLSGGYDPKGIIGGYCVMKKLENGDPDFEPMEFTREEALAYEEKHHIKGLYEGLRSLWRSKTWRRKNINDNPSPDTA